MCIVSVYMCVCIYKYTAQKPRRGGVRKTALRSPLRLLARTHFYSRGWFLQSFFQAKRTCASHQAHAARKILWEEMWVNAPAFELQNASQCSNGSCPHPCASLRRRHENTHENTEHLLVRSKKSYVCINFLIGFVAGPLSYENWWHVHKGCWCALQNSI